MNLIENLHLYSLSPFRSVGKTKRSSLPNNFDLICRSFDENILRRLKTLSSGPNQPSITLSWLSLAVDFLLLTQIEARNLISKLISSSASSDDSLSLYLDESVKLLDICNSISSEIERLRQRRLLVNFVLRRLEFGGDGSQIPPPESLRRARDSLSDWENNSVGSVKRRGFQTLNPESLVRDLAAGLENAPRGKISSAGKVVRRTIHAVGLVTVFVAGVVVSALYGLPEIVRVRVPTEFIWADSFNGLESAISAELKRRVFEVEEKKVSFDEIDDVAIRVRLVREAINGVEGDGDVDKARKEKLGSAVKQLETVTDKFSNGLDGLSNGVNALFDAVLCTRTSMLDNFRLTHHGKKNVLKE